MVFGCLAVLTVNVPRNRNSITFLILSLAQGMGQSSLSWISGMLKLWLISLNLTILKWDLGRRLGHIYCLDSRPCLHYVLFIVYIAEIVVPLETQCLASACASPSLHFLGICSKSRVEGIGAKAEGLEHEPSPTAEPFFLKCGWVSLQWTVLIPGVKAVVQVSR